MPLILNQVPSVADAVELMALGTANGPTRLGPLLRVMSAASTMARVEGPPEPMMMPVISWEISLASRPASRIACSMAIWFQAAPPPRKRMARRSIAPSGSRSGAPWTWQRKPSSAYLSARTMPDLASRRLARTSWVLLPMDETIPIPVTTTRFMCASFEISYAAPRRRSRFGWLRLHVAEQADLEVERTIDHRTVGREPAVGDAEHELGAHHAFDFDAVDDVLHGRQHLAGELQLPHAQCAALAGRAEPAEEEAEQLPQRVEPQAARHHRVALEMAGEEPEVGLEIEHRPHQALAVFAARFRDFGNAVEHQHGQQRPLDEKLAPAAGQQILIVEVRTAILHPYSAPPPG